MSKKKYVIDQELAGLPAWGSRIEGGGANWERVLESKER